MPPNQVDEQRRLEALRCAAPIVGAIIQAGLLNQEPASRATLRCADIFCAYLKDGTIPDPPELPAPPTGLLVDADGQPWANLPLAGPSGLVAPDEQPPERPSGQFHDGDVQPWD